MSTTLSPGNHYLPSKSAWEKYTNQGGQAEYRARAVQSQHDQVAELVGIPGYGWRIVDLVPCIPAFPAPEAAKPPETAPKLTKPTGPICSIEVSLHSFTTRVQDGDLRVEFEDDDDEDCAGEECETCDGEGCKIEHDPLSAVGLLEHLLDDYSNSAESYAELCEADASYVDDLYRDLLMLLNHMKIKT